jgi:GNAT superfamily N-acetyltransferase
LDYILLILISQIAYTSTLYQNYTVNQFVDDSYEIVWITSPEDVSKHEELIDSFFALYEHPSNFPDPDEREEPGFIRERIVDGTNDPHTHLLAYRLVKPDHSKQFIGGCIVEFYPDSGCALVTYLFVDAAYRGIKIGSEQKKVAESLISSQQGLSGLVTFFSNHYKRTVNAVLFESNNPFDTAVESDSMPPAQRLKFFSRMGAKRINFPYVQPPLDDDKGAVTNLYLLCFPQLTGLSDNIPLETVISFVLELTKSLDRNKDQDSITRYGHENYLHDLEVVRQLKGRQKLDPSSPQLIGLTVGDNNILRSMYNDLVDLRVNELSVALTEIPGAAV